MVVAFALNLNMGFEAKANEHPAHQRQKENEREKNEHFCMNSWYLPNVNPRIPDKIIQRRRLISILLRFFILK